MFETPQQLVKKEMDAVHLMMADELEQIDTSLASNIAKHVVNSGGKRIRPLLTLLVAGACGGVRQAHITMAGIIELIHTATILHDDVVDETLKRRNRVTANGLWGKHASVLVGDFMYSRALALLLAFKNHALAEMVIQGCELLSIGELRQIEQRGHLNTSEQMYFQTIKCKTATLFDVAARASDMLHDNSKYSEAVGLFGTHIGIAFQLRDDILDYIGDAQAIGKDPGTDLIEGTSTLPFIHALSHARKPAHQKLLHEAFNSGNKALLPEVVSILKSSGSIEYTQKQVQAHIAKATEALQTLPDSDYKTALTHLSQSTTERAV